MVRSNVDIARILSRARAVTLSSVNTVLGFRTAADGRVEIVRAAPSELTGTRVISTGSATNNSSTNWVAVPGISIPVVAGGLYELRIRLAFQTDAATTGLALQLANMPAMTRVALTAACMCAGVGGSGEHQGPLTVANGYTITFTAVALATTDYLAEIRGIFKPSAAGTIGLNFRSEVDTSVVTVQADAIANLTRWS